MIAGIGVDIVEIARISRSLDRFGNRFAVKILSPSEIVQYTKAKKPAHFLARRFAAKEATAKALGTGMKNGVAFRQIDVVHLASGAPRIRLTGCAQTIAEEKGIVATHLSISDEQEYAVATVVLECLIGDQVSP